MEKVNTDALNAFLLEANRAVTSLTVASSAHALMFYTLIAGVVATWLALWVSKRKGIGIYIPVLVCIPIIFAGVLACKYAPSNVYKFYRGGATSIKMIDPSTGLDPVSSQIIKDIYQISKEHTIYRGESPAIDAAGQRLLQDKLIEYVTILRDAKRIQTAFPLLYILLQISALSGIVLLWRLRGKARTVATTAVWSLWGAAAFVIYMYPIHYEVWGEKMHLPCLAITLFAITRIVTTWRRETVVNT